MITRFYYTFRELLNTEDTGWGQLFGYFGIAYTGSSYELELFNHVREEYDNEIVLYYDVKHAPWEQPARPAVSEIRAVKDVRMFVEKMKGWLDDSKVRYEKLIYLYNQEQTHLLDKVEAISTSQFNNTPQTTTTGLDGDGYATTYTKNTSSSDVAPIMQRLNEIRLLWDNLYGEWTKLFAKHFVIYVD